MRNYIHKIQQVLNPELKYILLFSGGYDSSAILGLLNELDMNVLPVWINNGFNRAYADEIHQQVRQLRSEHFKEINTEAHEDVCANPSDRCYICKKDILHMVSEEGFKILDGTVTDDLDKYRPGKKALEEFGVKSPLAEAGISKKQAKEIAQQYGAIKEVAEMESCLATRINYNINITQSILDGIREIERFIINETGDYDIRCRLDSDTFLRIEVAKNESFNIIIRENIRETLIKKAKKIVPFVTLDMEPTRPNAHDQFI